jgi:hypothetical protein
MADFADLMLALEDKSNNWSRNILSSGQFYRQGFNDALDMVYETIHELVDKEYDANRQDEPAFYCSD